MKKGIALLISIVLAGGFLFLVFGKASAFHLLPYEIHHTLFDDGTIGESLFIDIFDIDFLVLFINCFSFF